ncbi:MAG: class I SAM-dependent methyltransferase [Terriglobales bacterium]
MWQSIRRYFCNFGYRQVPVWYGSSVAVADQFETISKPLKFLKVIPNPYPFYDWIMGFHERWSNRAALRGPVLEETTNVMEAGVGTGYFLAQLVKRAKNARAISAVDLSPQMITAARNHLIKRNLLSSTVHFVRSDCRHLPYSNDMFDLYVSSYLFDLLNDKEIESTLKEMERVLSPNGHAILISMTTELNDMPWPTRFLCRVTNELYCLGYHKGRWNGIWKFLFAGYAPHCRPIALGKYLKLAPSLSIEYTKVSHVSLFPVRIYYVGKHRA